MSPCNAEMTLLKDGSTGCISCYVMITFPDVQKQLYPRNNGCALDGITC